MEVIVVIGALIVLAAIISFELRFPVAIMEIILGMLAANLLHLHTTEAISFLADLGILAIIFLAGVEIDQEILRKYFARSTLWALTVYFAQLFLVIVLMLFLGYNLDQAILVGIALSATSLALAYSVIRERGLAKYEAGQTILSVAMIIDVLSMLSLLYFITPEYDLTALFVGIAAILIIWLGPKISGILFDRYEGNLSELEIRMLVLFLVVAKAISETLGISEVILAFIIGLTMANILRDRKEVEEKIKGLVFGFLAPVFFFEAGMLIDLSYVNQYSLGLVVLFVLAIFTLAYSMSHLLFGKTFGKEFGSCAGLIFNFRLSFSIVAAYFGLIMGIIAEEIYVMIMLVILTTSLVSAIVLRLKSPIALIE